METLLSIILSILSKLRRYKSINHLFTKSILVKSILNTSPNHTVVQNIVLMNLNYITTDYKVT